MDATVNHATNALFLANALRNQLYIKLLYLPTTTSHADQTYVGLTSNSFKTTFANHKTSFSYVKKKHATELSNHIGQLKDKNVDYEIKWEIIKQASPYSNTSNRCNLCLWQFWKEFCNMHDLYLNKALKLIPDVMITRLMHAKALPNNHSIFLFSINFHIKRLISH